MAKRSKYIDIKNLKPMKKIRVDVNGKPADFRIGDKLRWPEKSPIVKTIVSMTVFEDGSINYQLKWFDGNDFKSELVSVSDLKLLNVNELPLQQIQLSPEEVQQLIDDNMVTIES